MKLWLQKTLSIFVFVAVLLQGLFIADLQKSEAQLLSGSGLQTAGPILGAGIGCGISKLLAMGAQKLSETTKVPISDSSTKALDNKENCLKKIARAAAQTLLRKITQSTVNWINTGFKGSPTFVQNAPAFFKSIADEEIKSLTAQIIIASPFGRDIARNLILSLQANFAMYAKYSLDKVIGSAQAQQFNADFTAGGWNGWLAMTQLPQNNQIGASIISSEELSTQIAGYASSKIQTAKEQLGLNDGFLSLEVCVDPLDYEEPPADWNRAEDMVIASLPSPNTPGDTGSYEPLDGASYSQADINAAKERLRKYTCLRPEVRTPGGVLSHQLYKVMDIPTDSLINSEDLDASITAIFDALLNQLMQQGLPSLADNSSNSSNSTQFTGSGNNASTNTNNSGSGTSGFQWNHPPNEFDINTDLPRIIQDQQDYLDLLGPADYVGGKLTKTGAINQIVPAIYKADFCLPGPAADWETTVIQGESNILSKMQKVASPTPVVYAGIFVSITGADVEQAGIANKERAMGLFQRVVEGGMSESSTPVRLDGFIHLIKKKFSLFNLPTVASEINQAYSTLPTYDSDRSEITNQIGQMKSNISKITYIKDTLPTALANQQNIPGNTDYDMLVRTFMNLTPGLVTSDDVETLESEVISIQFDAKDAENLFYRCRQEVDGIDKNGINVGTSYSGPNERRPYPESLLPLSAQTASRIPVTNAFLDDVNYGGNPLTGAFAEIHLTDVVNLNSSVLGLPILEDNLGIY